MHKKILVSILVSATVLLGGCVVTTGPVYREPIIYEPPPPRVEYPGYPPVVGYIWIGGYWTWTGHRHEWVGGRWEAPRPGYRWQAPRWERDGQHWRQYEGRWERDNSPRVVPVPAPQPRYEPRPEPGPVMRYEQRGAPEAPRRDIEQRSVPEMNRPMPPRDESRRMAPENRPDSPRDYSRGERGKERGQGNDARDERRGRRGGNDDR